MLCLHVLFLASFWRDMKFCVSQFRSRLSSRPAVAGPCLWAPKVFGLCARRRALGRAAGMQNKRRSRRGTSDVPSSAAASAPAAAGPGKPKKLDTRKEKDLTPEELKARHDGMAMVRQAAADGDTKKVRELAMDGCHVAGGDFEGTSALMKAAMYGHLDVIKVLIEFGADVDAKDCSTDALKRTPLILASANGHLRRSCSPTTCSSRTTARCATARAATSSTCTATAASARARCASAREDAAKRAAAAGLPRTCSV